MRKSLFETIVAVLVADDSCNYFQQKLDATGLPGFLPEQKVTCALRMLAYGACADQLDELIRMAESTVLETMKIFCSSIRRLCGPENLRKPTQHDLETLLDENAARGFPGLFWRVLQSLPRAQKLKLLFVAISVNLHCALHVHVFVPTRALSPLQLRVHTRKLSHLRQQFLPSCHDGDLRTRVSFRWLVFQPMRVNAAVKGVFF
ncbi:hypothetical protein DVH05_028624 [Phytophthora capsici]|nr:hypothetical protein DVH05_028624 [Phytophthora capsici]